MTPTGGLKNSCLEDYTGPCPSYLSEEELDTWKKVFLKNGFAAPTCWYKVYTTLLDEKEDDRQYLSL